jgi:hypothetical protein
MKIKIVQAIIYNFYYPVDGVSVYAVLETI